MPGSTITRVKSCAGCNAVCLVDLAGQIGTVLTLDRDFEIYRWRSRRKFELLIRL
jgi:hypothetical protein